MRIGIDARAAVDTPAGRGRYVRELLRGFAKLQTDDCYALAAHGRWDDDALDHRFEWNESTTGGPLWPLLAGRALGAKSDVVLAPGSYLMSAATSTPIATIVWDFSPFHPELQPPRGSVLERLTFPVAARRSDVFICISKATEAELLQRRPELTGKTVIATPAADDSFSPKPGRRDDEVLARLGLREPYILVTGTLEPRKNLPALIEAFAGLSPAKRGDWRLVLAGASGWETAETFAAVREHGELVDTLGFVDDADLPGVYRRAGLSAYLSRYEGFGIPVLEAMQSGVAVITSNVSSMPEVGGDAAIYADPHDVGDIRRVLGELLEDGARRERAAKAGPQQAARFSWSRSAATVHDALARIATR